MFKRLDVHAVIDEATAQFEKCWEFLANLKNGKRLDDTDVTILQFQPILAEALSKLSSVYRRIAEEKDATIQRKADLAPSWFARRMRFLSSQQDVVRRTLSVGKSIGDGFAWFFYQNNIDHLNEHLKEPEQLLIPSGMGGFAELETVKKIPVAAGHFLLYHGITSILRLGDFSLISIKDFKVITVGEIKSGKPADGKLLIQMIFPCDPVTGTTSSGSVNSNQNRDIKLPPHVLSPSARDRLNRQIQRMAVAHSKLTLRPDKHLSYEIEDRYSRFDRFLTDIRPGRISFMHMGKSTLLLGLPMRQTSLYARVAKSSKTDWKKKFEGLQREIIEIIIPGRQDNLVYISSWFYNEYATIAHPPGMTHPIWWPLSPENLHRIIFHEIMIFTIYNPAHLFQGLEHEGFTVTEVAKSDFTAKKQIADRIIELTGISHFCRFIQQYFLSEGDVIAILQNALDQSGSVTADGSSKIALQFVQRFGQPQGSENPG